MTTSIGTSRLIFEKLSADHAHGLFAELCDERVYEHIGALPAASISELAARFSYMAGGPPPDRGYERWLNYALRLRETNALIGRVEATLIERRAEVAFLIGFQHWGQGYAIEAMTELQRHLRQDMAITQFWATTAPLNERSIRLLVNLGYKQFQGTIPPLLSYDDGDLVFTRG